MQGATASRARPVCLGNGELSICGHHMDVTEEELGPGLQSCQAPESIWKWPVRATDCQRGFLSSPQLCHHARNLTVRLSSLRPSAGVALLGSRLRARGRVPGLSALCVLNRADGLRRTEVASTRRRFWSFCWFTCSFPNDV